MSTDLTTTTTDARYLLIPDNPNRDMKSRIGMFAEWLQTSGSPLYAPDLKAYSEHLSTSKAPASVAAHLSTIRAAYRRLLRDNDLRDELYSVAASRLETPADRKAFVDEQLKRMENALDPAAAPVKVVKHQDRADSEQIRLTREQAEQLLNAPGVVPIKALRDTAAIALMLCTGLREAELCALEVDDLRQSLGGKTALRVRKGKGCKERLIPYGELSWVLAIVDRWLLAAGVTSGPVMRSFWKNGKTLRGVLKVRMVEYIVGSYPIMIGDKVRTVRPHDLRRTYAARLYDAEMDILSISQNLGHKDTKTTLLYIGEQNAQKRAAAGVYSYDLKLLEAVT